MKTGAIILAAGKGTRMHSRHPKVLHRILNKPILSYVLDSAAREIDMKPVVVIGHGGEEVREYFGEGLHYRVQKEQLGTGDAVKVALPALTQEEAVFILCGDAPLIQGSTLQGMRDQFVSDGYGALVLTAVLPDPAGYGRIIRDGDGSLSRIVEEKDATPLERNICEINSGTYLFQRDLLEDALLELRNDNIQGEYYLTDTLEILRKKGVKVGIYQTSEPREILGINNRIQLEEAGGFLRKSINEFWMSRGVTMEDAATTYIDKDVVLGEDVILGPNVTLSGKTRIGDEVEIGSGSIIRDSIIGAGTVVMHSMIVESSLGEGCKIGPFAYLRPGNELAEGVKVGDFVELKKAHVGKKSKIPHHSYIGDSQVGAGVNIGAGTITCNYDGVNKHVTVIEDGAFIGSNTNLVAPVTVGRDAYIGAGSTITQDVPPGALGLERSKQHTVLNWKGRSKKDE